MMAEVASLPASIDLASITEAHEESLTSTALVAQPGASEELAAPGDAAVRKTKKIVRKKRRPARAQVDRSTLTSEPPPQTGTIFNIWYNKWSGGDSNDKSQSQTAAKGRCQVARDSGYTRADGVPGSYFCLFFARGICPHGHECQYLHRLPGLHDHFNPNVDVFGRDKHADYRDDMGGTGSFMRQNRTIYVGRIHVTDDIEEIVARHFAEWGQIERTRVLNTRGVAFLTYSNESNAQFAKEAMAHQSLDHNEILNVRWATADPNPMAQKREARRIEEQAAEAVRRALPAEFVAEIEGRAIEEGARGGRGGHYGGGANKRLRLEGGSVDSAAKRSFGLEGYEAPDDVYFARGANAVNPNGRQGHEAWDVDGREGMPLTERSTTAEQSADGEYDASLRSPESAIPEEGGIFSSSTLAALQQARAVPVKGVGTKVAAGPLVAYDSDSDG